MSSADGIDILMRSMTVDGPSFGGRGGIASADAIESTSAMNMGMPSAQRQRLRSRLGVGIIGKMGEASAPFMYPESGLAGNVYRPEPMCSGSSLTGLLIRLQGGEDGGGVPWTTAIVLEALGYPSKPWPLSRGPRAFTGSRSCAYEVLEEACVINSGGM